MKAITTALCLVFLSVGVSAAIVTVPDDFGTIQEGLDAVSAGDTVVVRAGSYSGIGNVDLWFGSEDIHLMSQDGPEVTILDGDSAQLVRAFNLLGSEAMVSNIDGFTIRHFTGSYEGGAILCDGSSPIISNCIFTQNAAAFFGGAIHSINEATPQILNCQFIENHAFFPASYAGAIGSWNASTTIKDCLFEGNSTLGYGGAIFFSHGGNPLVQNCRFESDTSIHGGACGHYAVSGKYENCLFLRNQGWQKGGVFFLQDNCSPEIKNCTFYDNSGEIGGVFFIEERFDQECSPAFENSLAAYNRTSPAFVIVNATPTFECTDLFGNVADWDGYLEIFEGGNGNLSANPVFCDTASGDLSIEFASPCAPENNACATLIGAGAVGCGPGLAILQPNPMYVFYAHSIEPMTGYCLVSMENESHGAIDIVESSLRVNSTVEVSNFEILPTGSIFDVFRIEFKVTGFINTYPLLWGISAREFVVSGEYADGGTFAFPGAFTSIGHSAGDVNGDNQINIGDVVFLINYIFRDGMAPVNMDMAETNCDGAFNLGDIVHLITYIFRDGVPPGCN